MTAATETKPPAGAPAPAAAPSRIGPFEILGRVAGERGAGVVTLSVVGADGGPYVGRRGVAECFSAPKDEAGRERLGAMLDGLNALDHPAIDRPLHAGIAGTVAYVANPEPSIAAANAPRPTLSPAEAAGHAVTLASALETAHRAGLSHGALSRRTVAIDDDGPRVSGWTLFGRGPAADQVGLAELVIDWLAGSPLPAAPSVESPEGRRARLGRHLDGLSEQVILVLSRATEPDPAHRYPGVIDFAAALAQAVARSGEDLVHGGFEAISRRSPEMAAFMAASAERYDPDAPGLDLLKIQLGGNGQGVIPAPSAMVQLAATASPTSGSPAVMPGLDPALTAGIPPEMLAMIAPPLPAAAKPRSNPWLVLVVGAAGLTLLLMAGVAIVVFAGSS